jgi:hypothetical protein
MLCGVALDAASLAACCGTIAGAKLMGAIYYTCDCCEMENSEGACYVREDVRLVLNGEWICQNCYDDAPDWTYVDRPLDPHDEEYDPPRWRDLPMVPIHLPVTSVISQAASGSVDGRK